MTITQETEQASIPIVNVDEEGFLVQPEIWTKEVAQFLALDEVEGELTEEHWKVIDYFRKYYLEFKSVPPVRKMARDTGCDLKRACMLFPSGLTMGACRIAGLPRLAIRPGLNYP